MRPCALLLLFTVRRLPFLALALAAVLPASGATVVHYPRPESHSDERASYPIMLLRLSLEKSGAAFRLEPSAARMQQGRSLRFLEQGRQVDVVWTVSSARRERQFLPVRIPIDRGLIGMRLLLVHQSQLARFSAIHDRAGLAALRAGQGHDWPDTEVLRANGMKVATSTVYEGLFTMLERGHIDYFPRSVGEVWPELAARPGRGLAAAPGLVLYYPQALYFFVRRGNDALAGAIERGLRAAIADGSMERLFRQFYGPALARAGLDRRTALVLDNPVLPASAPTGQPALWLPAPGVAGSR